MTKLTLNDSTLRYSTDLLDLMMRALTVRVFHALSGFGIARDRGLNSVAPGRSDSSDPLTSDIRQGVCPFRHRLKIDGQTPDTRPGLPLEDGAAMPGPILEG